MKNTENKDEQVKKIVAKSFTFTDGNGSSLRFEEEIDDNGFVVSIMNPLDGRNTILTMRLSRDQWDKIYDIRYQF